MSWALREMRPSRSLKLGGLLACLLALSSTAALAQTTERVSVSSNGAQGNDDSGNAGISDDGRFVVFDSSADNLVPGDGNGVEDIFLHDRESGVTRRLSVASDGAEADAGSHGPVISADGSTIAFSSDATNLVPGDGNKTTDIFVHERLSGVTERVSVSSSGQEANNSSFRKGGLSADGRFVAFDSFAQNLVPNDTNSKPDVFVRDRKKGTTERVSVSSSGKEGNDYSQRATISADGRFVAFDSLATNLVPGDGNGAIIDAFVHDRQSGTTELVSVSSSGKQGNGSSGKATISGDGRFVAFPSDANNLVPGDSNGMQDIFVHERLSGMTERVSVSSSGQEAEANSSSFSEHGLSADGRFVAFDSDASNLVPGDSNGVRDIFLHDRETGITELISVDSAGGQGNERSRTAAVTAEGRLVVYQSDASNLVPGDSNGVRDIFVRDRAPATASAMPWIPLLLLE